MEEDTSLVVAVVEKSWPGRELGCRPRLLIPSESALVVPAVIGIGTTRTTTAVAVKSHQHSRWPVLVLSEPQAVASAALLAGELPDRVGRAVAVAAFPKLAVRSRNLVGVLALRAVTVPPEDAQMRLVGEAVVPVLPVK